LTTKHAAKELLANQYTEAWRGFVQNATHLPYQVLGEIILFCEPAQGVPGGAQHWRRLEGAKLEQRFEEAMQYVQLALA